jgi:hypothetical protein
MLVGLVLCPNLISMWKKKISTTRKCTYHPEYLYEPVNITFHDDHADTVNAFWKAYYEYNIQDSFGLNLSTPGMEYKDDYYNNKEHKSQYGLDGAQKRGKASDKGIQIFALHKQNSRVSHWLIL